MVPKKAALVQILILAIVVFSQGVHSAVLINEILANGLDDPEHEWVELFNNASNDANLTNWNISETSSSNFTINAVIPANGFIILAADFATFNSTYPNTNLSGIRIIDIAPTNFNLADTSGEVRLYNSSGFLADSVSYVQQSGKSFENVSIGRYPDGSQKTFNISTLTPGFKNDNQFPRLNKWINPQRNNTNVSGMVLISVNVTDDTTGINSSKLLLNGTNFSMSRSGELWSFLWNTSIYSQKRYNLTIFFNDSYSKSASDSLLNILVNNSPNIFTFSPSSLLQSMTEGNSMQFSANASDPDDSSFNISWLLDGSLASSSYNFTYNPGPSDNGTHTINFTAMDKASSQSSIAWVVSVANVNLAPAMQDIQNMTIPKNSNLSFNISASDFDNDVLAYASNHSGFIISKINNSIAAASWKPTNLDIGSHVINFTVSDGSLKDSKIVMVSVSAAGNRAPAIFSSPMLAATRNEPYAYRAQASDADNDSLTFSLSSDAAGISIGASTGTVSFTPISAGVFNVTIMVSDLVETANQSFTITAGKGGMLKIIDVDAEVDGKKSSGIRNKTRIGREAKPGSKLELRIKLRNEFIKAEGLDIEDISLKATIDEINRDDDLEQEASEFNLRPESEKTSKLSFDIPIDAEDGTFDVLIEAEGEDENGTLHEDFFEAELELEKEKHDVRLLDFSISPSKVSCGKPATISYEALNAGLEDEDITLIIKSPGLKINYQHDASLGAGTEDSTLSKTLKLVIDQNAANGEHRISAEAHYADGDLADSAESAIVIDGCQDGGLQLLSSGNPASATTSKLEKISGNEKSFSGDVHVRLLLLSTLAFTLFFVFTAYFLFTKV